MSATEVKKNAKHIYCPVLEQNDMQAYMQTYARRLVQVTLKAGNTSYLEKLPVIYYMRYLILGFSVVIMAMTMMFTRIFANTLINPMVMLARSSRKIAKYDFSEPDLAVDGRLYQYFEKEQ